MLAGDEGPAVRRAMQIVVTLGRIYEAERLLPVTSVQVAGVSYRNLGDAGLEFLQEWATRRVRVPTTLNPAGMDLRDWQRMGISEAFALKQKEVIAAYTAMGIQPTCTCTPYYVGNVPQYGDHLAWSESSAVCYANAVLGRAHQPRGRPQRAGRGALRAHRRLWPAPRCRPPRHAPCAGALRRARTARIRRARLRGGAARGRRRALSLRASICRPWMRTCSTRRAALWLRPATSSSCWARRWPPAARWRSTTSPESRPRRGGFPTCARTASPRSASTRSRPRWPRSTRRCKTSTWWCSAARTPRWTNCARWPRPCAANACAARLWITTARAVRDEAARQGWVQDIEAAGGLVVADSCVIVAPMRELRYHTLATNSAKMASYALPHAGLRVRFGSTEHCLAAALDGHAGPWPSPWGRKVILERPSMSPTQTGRVIVAGRARRAWPWSAIAPSAFWAASIPTPAW